MIVALGDLMLDLTVQAPWPLPPALAPSPSRDLRRDGIPDGAHCSMQAHVSPGGSAANFAVWAARLGAESALIAKVGNDVVGRSLLDDLQQEGVRSGVALGKEATGFTLAIGDPHGQRSMMAARGATATLSVDDLDWTLLNCADWLHVTAYSFFEDAPRDAALTAMRHVQKRGKPVSLDPASSSYLQGIGSDAFFALAAGVDVLFPNWDEGRALTGEDEPGRIVRALLKRFPMVALKLDRDGAVAGTRGVLRRVPSPAVPVVDPVGAGDAFAAAFVVTWLAQHDLAAALQEANRIAARVVQALGARAMAGPPAS